MIEIQVGQTYKGDFATYTVTALATDTQGVTVRNNEGGYEGAYNLGSFEAMVAQGHVALVDAAPAAVVDAPQYVVVEGATAHRVKAYRLTDRDGQPVAAGEHTAKDGDRFVIEADPELRRMPSGLPRYARVHWLTSAGKPVGQPGGIADYCFVPHLVKGWEWTPDYI